VLVGVAGLTLRLKVGGGLYWMIPAVVASLAGGMINAWLFLVRMQVDPGPGSQADRSQVQWRPVPLAPFVRWIPVLRWISGTGIPVINRRTEINRSNFRIVED